MGFRHTFARWMGWTSSSATFSESAPRPIAQLFAEMMGQGAPVSVGRIEAMSVPAVQRGRNLICSISTLPLLQYGPDRRPVRNPLFEQIDPDVPNVVTIAQTLEDLLFEGISWWRITNQDYYDFPLAARHVDVNSVTINPPITGESPAPLPSGYDPRGGVVWIDGRPVPWSEVIAFHSPNPGLLKVAGRPIRRAILLDKAASMYADEPRATGYFSAVKDVAEPSPDAVEEALTKWRFWRKKRQTGYVPAGLAYNVIDQPTPADLQLVELQKQASLDIANALGLDPEDLGISTTSRTYQNATDRRQDRINDVLSPYMRAITDRLSMGDVTRRGHRVRFNLDDYMRADPKTRIEYYRGLRDLEAITNDEIREEEYMPTLTAAQKRELAPKPAPAPVMPQSAIEASSRTALELSAASGLTFAFEAELAAAFAVDRQARTITGLAVPYGKVALSKGRRWSFAPGSLQYSVVSRVKLLRDHDYSQAVGKAIELTETPEGLVAKFRVARGPIGDAVLDLADDEILDGLSIGVDFSETDTTDDPQNQGVTLVRRADLREVSLTAMPAFDDSRITSVAASRTQGDAVTDNPTTEPQAPTAPAGAPDLNELFSAWQAQQNATPPAEPEVRQVVNPTRAAAATFVNEPTPYRFDRGGNFVPTEHVFSADVHEMALSNDQYGNKTEAGKRVMGLLQAEFATVSTDVNELNPAIQRPDMYVDQRDYRTPLWDFVNKGAPPNGVQPFIFPKFAAASGLVGDHTEGTEPDAGVFTTTDQTVTPTALSGKASLTRVVWDMGGNPAVSTLIWNQMKRGYREGLESATATFLNTLTAAADIALGVGPTAIDEVLQAAWDGALADLQFIRGYDFSAFAIEKNLYKAFVAAVDNNGRKLYPIIAPQNANGTAASRFRTLDLGGVTGVPSWALPAAAGSLNNSWLFDPFTVHGWATAPQRLEFPGTDAAGDYAPVAMVDIAIWGYKAFANSDIGGVRQVTYDTTV